MRFLDRFGITVSTGTEGRFSLTSLTYPDTLQTVGANYGDRARVAIAAVYRAQQMLGDMSAQLSWSSFRGSKKSDQAQAVTPERVDPTPSILVDPSPFMARDDVIRTIVTNLIFRGFAPMLLQQLDPEGRPRYATPLNPDEVHVSWNDDRMSVQYRWRGQVMVPGVDFAVIELQRLPGEPKGIGPLDAAARTIYNVDIQNRWAEDLFSSSGIPSGVIQVPGKLTEDEATALKAQWQAQHAQRRGTAVLSGGMQYSATALTPEQAQFLATRGFGLQEISRLLGVPQHFLNAGQLPGSSQSLTYTNVQAVFRELTNVTLYPTYLNRIEEAFTKMLPRGQAAVFDLSDLTKADDKSRFEAWKVALDAGIVSVEEVREAEGLSPNLNPSIGEI